MRQPATGFMPALIFVDTNVLIYARDRKAEDKRAKARAWLAALAESGLGHLNLQVLNEFTRWVLANESQRRLEDVRKEVDALRGWGDKPLDEEEVELAWAVRQRLGYQWFDCLLIAAAEFAGCDYFLTEDMGEDVAFHSVKLIHPFRTAPSDILSLY
jgi:predicted nucleic acid-binding protein